MDENPEYKLVCSESELKNSAGHRKIVTINERSIVIFYKNGEVFAVDSFCNHAGGPLVNGDIEDINGTLCVICPWHKYKICLKTGEGHYQGIDPKDLTKPPEWKSKGVKQRTHHSKIQDGNIYICINTDSVERESDFYYSNKYKQMVGDL